MSLPDEGSRIEGLPANSLNISLLEEKLAEEKDIDKSFNQEPSFLEQESSSQFLKSVRKDGKITAFNKLANS